EPRVLELRCDEVSGSHIGWVNRKLVEVMLNRPIPGEQPHGEPVVIGAGDRVGAAPVFTGGTVRELDRPGEAVAEAGIAQPPAARGSDQNTHMAAGVVQRVISSQSPANLEAG